MTHTSGDHPDAIQALHMDAKRYPGGISALAQLLGRSAGVLHNKFAESMPNYDVTDREAFAMACAIRQKLGSLAYIEAKCASFGGLFVPLPDGEAGESDLLQAQLDMMERFGELAREFTESRRDGLITLDEVAVIRVVGQRLIRAVHAFIKEVETQVHPEEPLPEGVTLIAAER